MLTQNERHELRKVRFMLRRKLLLMARNTEHRRIFGCRAPGLVVSRNLGEKQARDAVRACIDSITLLLS